LRKLHLLLPFALLALVLGLVACGGGESDEDKIAEVIETSATSTDPADCAALSTQAFLEQMEFSEGEEAVESCEEDAKDTAGDPESVEVSAVEVDGSDATAEAEFVGGDFDGQVLAVALVEEDGDWKMDEIVRFAKFDQEGLASAFERSVQDGGDALDPEVASCMGDTLREISEPEAEEVVIGGSSEPIVAILEACE
jgi:hypothetical protein